MISRTGSIKIKEMIGVNMTDYVCVITWDRQFECIRYHYVHKSSPNPVEEVKNSFPFEEVY